MTQILIANAIERLEDKTIVTYPIGRDKQSLMQVTLRNESLVRNINPPVKVSEATDEQLRAYAPYVVKAIKEHKKKMKGKK